jgi:hypothetical protein
MNSRTGVHTEAGYETDPPGLQRLETVRVLRQPDLLYRCSSVNPSGVAPRVHVLLVDILGQWLPSPTHACPRRDRWVMQGRKHSFWRFQIGTNQLRETTLTELLGVGRGANKPTLEKKCHENWGSNSRPDCLEKTDWSLWRGPGSTQDCRTSDDDDDE